MSRLLDASVAHDTEVRDRARAMVKVAQLVESYLSDNNPQDMAASDLRPHMADLASGLRETARKLLGLCP